MIIVLDNIRSIFNVGAIFRTTDSVGAEKLILGGYTPHPPLDKLNKTALGAVDYVDWEHLSNDDMYNYLITMKEKGYKIISVEQDPRSIPYTDERVIWENSIYVFGNEIAGVQSQIMDISDHIIEIPMNGKKNSLNVSVTVGIVSYEVRTHMISC